MLSYSVLALFAIFALAALPACAGSSKSWSDEDDQSLEVLPKRYPEYLYDYASAVKAKRGEVAVYDDALLPKAKRDDDETLMRLCGMKLVAAAVEICQGCIKPAGMTLVGKRSVDQNGFMSHIAHKRSEQQLTDMCCKNMCTRSQIKSDFCC